MLQPRHRSDKENQVHRLPKTPGPGKSIISKNPLKTPFHDENHSQKFHQTAKKSVVFGQSTNQPDPTKLNVFQTPGIRFSLNTDDSSSTNPGRKGFEYETHTLSCPSIHNQTVQQWSRNRRLVSTV
jgi:hypothetical protein